MINKKIIIGEKRFVPIFDGFDKRVVGAKDNGAIISFMDMFDLLNESAEENKELKHKIVKIFENGLIELFSDKYRIIEDISNE